MNLHSLMCVIYVLACSKANTSSKITCRNIQKPHDRKCSAMCAALGMYNNISAHNSNQLIDSIRLKHEDSLRKHLKRHQDTFANCPICNKVLQNKHSLGNHIRSVHGERTHQCTLCAKAFKKAIVLKVNIPTKNEKVVWLEWKNDGMLFQEHMALHTGQDLYKCPYCTKTFKSGANMHAHRKKAHFEEWTRDRSKRFTPTAVE